MNDPKIGGNYRLYNVLFVFGMKFELFYPNAASKAKTFESR